MATVENAKSALEAHRRSADDLNKKLEEVQGVNKDKLHAAMDKYRDAVTKFHDDVLGCMN